MKNIKLILAVILLSSVSSCMDFSPEAQMNDDIVWTKATNFRLFANQFYAYTRDFSSGAGYQHGTADGPHSDLRSDLIAGSNINEFSRGTNAIPATDGNYGSLYNHIYYCNLLLSKAESFGSPDEIKVPVAEARFFRAYCYFELVQIYGDAIIVTKPLDLDSPELKATRNSRGEVVDQILTDLKAAIEGLPETPSEAGRLGKDAAWAFMSRVALFEGTWQKFHTGGTATTDNTVRSTELLKIAKEAARQVIDRKHYKLFYNALLGTESYRYMFILEDEQNNPAGLTTADNTEYILARRHRTADGIGTNITKAYLANAVYPTRKLADMFLCQNGLPISYNGSTNAQFGGYSGAATEFGNRDNRMLTTLIRNGDKAWNNTANNCRIAWNDSDLDRALTIDARSNSGYQTHKWAVERQVADNFEAMNYPVIRYAEVLLNYAEAVYELEAAISDADLDLSLNLVRNRVNPYMPRLSNALVTVNNLSMRDEIRRERTVELLFEGFRIDDLKRWATAPTEMPMDQVGVHFTGTWFESNWPKQSRTLDSDGCILLYGGRVWDNKLYLYPLPSDQTQLNPALGQNPGWKD